MEKNLIIIVIIIAVVVMAAAVIFRLAPAFLKATRTMEISDQDKLKTKEEYKRIIQQSQSDYKDFMEQEKRKIKNPH